VNEKDVTADDKSVTFTLNLEQGRIYHDS